MVMNLLVIALVLGLSYAWLTRGFFSAFLHMVCVLVGGAIAFAAWEPVSYLLLGVLPTTGFFRFTHGMSWGIGLVAPFVVATIVLRVAIDRIVRANLQFAGIVDMLGGAVCGFVASTIAVGLLVIAMGTMRLGSGFLGYQPVWYSQDRQGGSGSLVANDTLWLPADALTVKLYSGLSHGVFASSEPLSKWHPNLRRVGFANRLSPKDGQGRNTYRVDDFSVTGRYVVGDPKGGSAISDLLKDMRDEAAQPYRDLDDKAVSQGYLAGFVVKFKAGAKENAKRGSGPVVVSNGQVRLLVEDGSGQTHDIFPVAVISQAKAGEGIYGRWRFDSENVFVASVGGASTADMAFEFVVPSGSTPLALYVKQARALASKMPQTVAYSNVAKRDGVVSDGAIMRGGAGQSSSSYDDSEAIVIDTSGDNNSGEVQATSKIGTVMHIVKVKRFFEVDETNNDIISGEGTYPPEDVARGSQPTDKKLRTSRFSIAPDQAIIRVVVGIGHPASLLGPVARLQPADAPIVVIDQNGTAYDAAGFYYADNESVKIRYTPADPLGGTRETPSMSSSRDDQQLDLIFVVSRGVMIESMAIGDTVIVKFEPPVEARTE